MAPLGGRRRFTLAPETKARLRPRRCPSPVRVAVPKSCSSPAPKEFQVPRVLGKVVGPLPSRFWVSSVAVSEDEFSDEEVDEEILACQGPRRRGKDTGFFGSGSLDGRDRASSLRVLLQVKPWASHKAARLRQLKSHRTMLQSRSTTTATPQVKLLLNLMGVKSQQEVLLGKEVQLGKQI